MAKIRGKYVLHCNGIDPFVTLMGNFNWGPISGNDIVSSTTTALDTTLPLPFTFSFMGNVF